MNLDIINQINQSVVEESKEVKAEELQDKERVLEKNTQTSQKIEQERAVLTVESSGGSGFGLNKPKSDGQSFFKKSSSSSSLDDFFDKKEKEPEKKTSSGYGYGYTQPKKEETKQEKAREFANAFAKRAVERAHKEWVGEEEQERNSWNIFELQENAEEARRETRSLTKEDKKKLRNKDIIAKSALKGLASAGRGLIEYLYSSNH